MAVRIKIKTIELAERCKTELAYWYSIRPGDKFCVGVNEMIATGITPHGTHIVSVEGKWSPRDLGLHKDATSAIRLQGEAMRKELLKNKPDYNPFKHVDKKNNKRGAGGDA